MDVKSHSKFHNLQIRSFEKRALDTSLQFSGLEILSTTSKVISSKWKVRLTSRRG